VTWNHRIVREKNTPEEAEVSGEEYYYTIREVYYDDDGKPELVSLEGDAPFGTTLEELKQDVERFAKALKYLVLDFEDFSRWQ